MVGFLILFLLSITMAASQKPRQYGLSLNKLLHVNATHYLMVGHSASQVIVSLCNSDGVVVASSHSKFRVNVRNVDNVLYTRNKTVIALLECSNPYTDSGKRVACIVAFTGPEKLGLLWERMYDELPIYSDVMNKLIETQNAKECSYVLSWDRYRVVGVGADGNILWKTGSNADARFAYSGKELVIAHLSENSTVLSFVEPNENLTLLAQVILEYVYLTYMRGIKDSGGVVITGEYDVDFARGRTLPLVARIDGDRNLLWIKLISTKVETCNLRVVEIGPRYLVYGSMGAGYTERGLIVNILPDGTQIWRKSFTDSYVKDIRDIIELSEGEYVMIVSDGMGVSQYAPPAYPERRRCHDLSDCLKCPKGLFWNYTVCSPCPSGCTSCIDPDLCLDCSSQRLPDGSCVPVPNDSLPCNCSSDTIREDCVSLCPAAYCKFDSKKSHSVKRNRNCICPNDTFDNGTHCFRVEIEACPYLCASCVNLSANLTRCLECRNWPHVFSSTIDSTRFLKCTCDSLHYRPTAAGCVLVEDISKGKEEARAPTGALMGVAVIIGALVLAAVVWHVMRRRSRNALHAQMAKADPPNADPPTGVCTSKCVETQQNSSIVSQSLEIVGKPQL